MFGFDGTSYFAVGESLAKDPRQAVFLNRFDTSTVEVVDITSQGVEIATPASGFGFPVGVALLILLERRRRPS